MSSEWYIEVCQSLDILRAECHEFADEGEQLPPPELFDFVKQQIQDLRRLAGYPILATPDIWLTPGGQIGVTWNTQDRQLDLIYSMENLVAKLRVNAEKSIVEPNLLAVELNNFVD